MLWAIFYIHVCTYCTLPCSHVLKVEGGGALHGSSALVAAHLRHQRLGHVLHQHIYIYIYAWIDRQIDTYICTYIDTDRQIDRQTDTFVYNLYS